MKKGVIILLLLISLNLASATVCDLDVSLFNQDPYPAVPSEYVKLVFQVEGIESTDCSDITFELLKDYPLEFDPGKSGTRVFKKVDYIKDFESNLLIPYEVRVNKDALDGANPIEVRIQNKGDSPLLKTFDIEVDDVKADFEVYVKDYNYATNELTLEILNIGSSDIEALSVEISKQEGIEVKGAKRIVVGDLDSNEYTSADFEVIPSNGEFQVSLTYSDTINTRRTVEKTVTFDSSYFTNRIADQSTTGVGTYIFYTAILIVVIWWIAKRFKKKKK